MKKYLLALLLSLLSLSGAAAANRFAVCTTACTWDGSSTAMWSASSGGATGASVPVLADTVTLDAATCVGGTTCAITVNTNFSINTLTMNNCTASAAGCILDFSANNNSPTIGAGGVNGSGTGTRTLNMGSGTWTVTNGGSWFFSTITGLTFNAGGSTLVLQQAALTTSIVFGQLTFNTVSVVGISSGQTLLSSSGNQTIATLNYTVPGSLSIANGAVLTLTNGLSISGGSLSNMFELKGGGISGSTAITSTNNSTVSFAVVHDIVFNGGGTLTANNSVSLGHTTGVTVNVPAGSSGGRCIGC